MDSKKVTTKGVTNEREGKSSKDTVASWLYCRDEFGVLGATK
jgi:hypothetical protein